MALPAHNDVQITSTIINCRSISEANDNYYKKSIIFYPTLTALDLSTSIIKSNSRKHIQTTFDYVTELQMVQKTEFENDFSDNFQLPLFLNVKKIHVKKVIKTNLQQNIF